MAVLSEKSLGDILYQEVDSLPTIGFDVINTGGTGVFLNNTSTARPQTSGISCLMVVIGTAEIIEKNISS